MLEDRDPLDQEYLDGFGMHHFGIGPTDAEDKNLREDEASPLETIEKYVAVEANTDPIRNKLTPRTFTVIIYYMALSTP
jgi:hypothetical protein